VIKGQGLDKPVSFFYLEDTQSYVEQMQKDLTALGLVSAFDTVKSVPAAIEAVSKNTYDFILSDFYLPDGTGLDFLTEVRKMAKYRETPFLVATTEDDVGNMISCIEAGANDYLVKPWEIEELKEKINLCWSTYHGK